MTTKKHSFLKIALCLILTIAIFPFAKLSTVHAETTKLTLNSLLTTKTEQEITSSLEINSNFENGSTEGPSGTASWGTPTIGTATITQVNVADLTKNEVIGYKTENDVKFSDIGTDGTTGNKYGLLFKLSESGIAGIESTEISIPAHAYYVLSFNVKIPALDNTGAEAGFNAKIIHEDQNGETVTTSLNAIKTTKSSYTTYAFLIQGNEHTAKSVRLQFLLGNAVLNDEGEVTESKQIGYAAVDTIRMFSVNQKQFAELIEDKTCKEVSLLSQNSKYITIENGYFNETANENWSLAQNTTLSSLAPLNWEHSGDSNGYGIVNTNETLFENRLNQIGISSVNPGNPDGRSTTKFNNVLLLNNETASNQTLKSSQFVLAKNSYYRVSFSFNTPATINETNGISFYVVDADGKAIYSQENIYSYEEFSADANTWASFNFFVETDTAEKKVNFIITFGTQEKPAKGVAFVDEVSLTKVSATTAFANTEANKYPLTNEEGEDQKYLEEGIVSFENLKELDSADSNNRTISLYSYKEVKTETESNTPNEDTKEDDSNEFNSALLWYVIPSVLLGACLIAGLILYFVKKIKIKKPKSKKPAKTAYDRKRTLNKQVEKQEKVNGEKLKQEYHNQLEQVQKEIAELETTYQNEKQNKHTLQAYLSKRKKLQNKETQLKDQINKINK